MTPKSATRRLVAALALAAALAAVPAAAAPGRGPVRNEPRGWLRLAPGVLLEQAWTWVAQIWEKQGPDVDPNGLNEPSAPTGDERGPDVDPNGSQTEQGPSVDPNG
jgi:hypothetical protein